MAVLGGKEPGFTADQLMRSVLCSRMMSTLPEEFSGITVANFLETSFSLPTMRKVT